MKALAILLLACCALVRAVHAEPAVTNLAMLFDEVWQRNATRSEAERRADFRATVVARFPQFYGIERNKGSYTEEQLERRWDKQFREYERLRPAYLKVAEEFGNAMPRHLDSFRRAFPDYEPGSEIYLLHSLGEFDGTLRVLDGKRYLLFGADRIVQYHAGRDLAPLFHHELFHEHHDRWFAGCKGLVWTSLWSEGLASHVAKRLNPDAGDDALLLDFPQGAAADTRRRLPAALADLARAIESDDKAAHADLFKMRSGMYFGLPPRRGYLLGFLVAGQVARTHTLEQMARLSCDDARTQVLAAVRALREAHPSDD